MRTLALLLFILYKIKCYLVTPACWISDHDYKYMAEGHRSVQVECRRCGYVDVWSKAEWARYQKRAVKCQS